MEQKLALLFTVKIIYTFSKALLILFLGGWYRQRCQRCLTAFVSTSSKLQQVLALCRNMWYKVRPEDFLFISIHLTPKMLCATYSYPRSKHSLSDTCTVHDTATLFSSTAAAFSQRRQRRGSCSHREIPWCIPSFALQLFKSATATAEEETTSFLFTTKYSDI